MDASIDNAAPPRPAAPTLAQPADAREAHRVLAALGANAAAIGGGTALQLGWPDGIAPSLVLVDVSRLPQAQGLQWPHEKAHGTAQPALRIGCAMTLAALERAAGLRSALPLLGAALAAIGAPGVRTLATLGGNIGWRHGDTVAALLALDATVELAHGEPVPLADWLAQARPPLAVAVRVPLGQPAGWFEKVGGREAFSPSRLTLAGCGGRLAAVAGDLPGRRLRQAEQWLATAGATLQGLAEALAIDLADTGRSDAWRVTAATHLIRARAAI
jgi:CO/xanthine dehydrogenase FAD-binding subunit